MYILPRCYIVIYTYNLGQIFLLLHSLFSSICLFSLKLPGLINGGVPSLLLLPWVYRYLTSESSFPMGSWCSMVYSQARVLKNYVMDLEPLNILTLKELLVISKSYTSEKCLKSTSKVTSPISKPSTYPLVMSSRYHPSNFTPRQPWHSLLPHTVSHFTSLINFISKYLSGVCRSFHLYLQPSFSNYWYNSPEQLWHGTIWSQQSPLPHSNSHFRIFYPRF